MAKNRKKQRMRNKLGWKSKKAIHGRKPGFGKRRKEKSPSPRP